MPKPRNALINEKATPYYHCVSRCVRRAFLCGQDAYSGRSYEHRRDWVEDRLLTLSNCFAIQVCAYAVMSNHTHTVLFIDKSAAMVWPLSEVIERWHRLFAGSELSQRYLRGDELSQTELQQLQSLAEQWRDRLHSVSWFMRCLNEHIARLANREDKCTGRFWEGRFKSQALLDEAALVASLAYVDLNPVRVELADTPETSDFTSVQRRMRCRAESAGQPPELMPFVGEPRSPMPTGLPFCLDDYLSLVDWTGRIVRPDKPGKIPDSLPPILCRMQIEPHAWFALVTGFETSFANLVGRIEHVEKACVTLGQRWARGANNCRKLF